MNPCQDVSAAGLRQGLKPGTRSGLWVYFAQAIDQLRPALVVIENVRGLLSAQAHSDMERDCWCVGDEREPALRALGAVLGDLADIGYDARWAGVRASDVGAPHQRFRVFIAAHPHSAARGEWRQPAPGQTQSGGPRPDVGGSGGAPAADADSIGWDEAVREPGHVGTPPRQGAAARPDRDDQPARPVALLPTPRAQNGEPRNHTVWARPLDQPQNLENALARDFGVYAPAVARWEQALGRPAPPPTEGRRLNPAFVEFLMGLPLGHVTGVRGLSYAAQLKALGNGVVPQQAAHALRVLGIAAAMADQWGHVRPSSEGRP